jgi:oxygen-dependent protoporphyrinogen oxidase
MPRVVVIGGGIAGLSAAQRLAQVRPDAEIIVLEAADRVGGKLRRVQVGGSWVDVGAEAMLARRPEGLAAVEAAGLAEDVVTPLTTAALLRNRGTNKPLPARTLIGIPTDVDAVRTAGILSEQTLQHITDEPRRMPYPVLVEDRSVGDLVAERFGQEVVDRMVDPLLGGVYAGHANRISVQAALSGLANRLVPQGDSLLRAASETVAAGARDDTGQPVFVSVRGGLARLADQISRTEGISVRTGATVRAIDRTPAGFRLVIGAVRASEEVETDGVIVATPPGKAAALLTGLAPAAAVELGAIETASVVIVTLAFRLTGDRMLPAGSGILIPNVEGLDTKAMTFSSQKWPAVGGDSGVLLLRASLGRAGEEWVLQKDDEDLVALVRSELAEVTGLAAQPVDTHVQRWGGALPQYAVGHLQRVARIRSAVGLVDGLGVCGATYDGVGIPACIASAHNAADRVLAALAVPGQ